MDFVATASQYFLNPYGLLAALGLIPLIVFYLIKPKPKEQIMPSMMFFMKDKNNGKISQALQTLFRNLLLLFHVLFIIGLAAAVAQPYMEGFQKPDQGVVVFDRSASMENDLQDAKSFANSNLAKENTLIVVGREISIPLEEASAGQVRSYINGLDTRDVETDIGSGLEAAQDYDGQVVVASDLDQSVNSRDIEELVGTLQQSREVKIFEPNRENSWGIVGVNPSKQNSTVEIQNFKNEEVTIGVRTDEGARRITIEPESVKTVTVRTDIGTNTVELEEDELGADNKAFISIPEDKQFEVLFIGNNRNPYFSKVVELISFTTIRYEAPPIDGELDADVYVIGESDNILEGTAKEIESQVRSGAGLVLFAQEGLRGKGFSSAPKITGSQDRTVEISEPVRVSLGETRVYTANGFNGESYSNPREAVMKKQYGKGEVVFYNAEDSSFNTDFMYPIFWKNVLSDITQRPSVNELNLETGARIEGSEIITPDDRTTQDQVTALQTGFYNSSNRVYAVNLESEDESFTEEINAENEEITQEKSKQDIQHMAAILLALLAIMEMLYLYRIGDI